MHRLLLIGLMMLAVSFGAQALTGSGDSASGALETVPPTLNAVSTVTERSLSATFSEPMLAPGVATPGNYAASGLGLGTLSVNPDGVSGTGPYILSWSSGEMLDGETVTLTVVGLQDAVGNPINPAHNSASGTGIGITPVFTNLAANPVQASTGEKVTITFTSSESLNGDPSVTVNGHDATWVSGSKAVDFTYEYEVQPGDPLGMANVLVTGFDPAGNLGSLNSDMVLEIVDEQAGLPLYAWPAGFALLIAGIVLLAKRRRPGAALLVLALPLSASAFAQAPTVSNVAFVQQDNGAGDTEVVITYDLDAPNGPCDITVSLSKDGGADGYSHPVTSVTGDIAGVETGAGKHIVWDIRADYPEEDIPNASIRVTAEDGLPAVETFTINAGAASSAGPSVTLDNTATNTPTEYMASESPDFTGATWQVYDAAPTFTLSAGEGGTKTVYFKVRNVTGESAPASDTIELTGQTVNLPGDVPLELVWVPAGSFLMGRYPGEQDSFNWEDPQHPVTLAYGFWMGKYEITQQQWLAVRGSWPGDSPFYGYNASHPAYPLSWNDAQDFITSLNAHLASSGQEPLVVRLPSESEWEYACRAGTATRFYFGDAPGCDGLCSDCEAGTLPGNVSDYMWYCATEVSPIGIKPVGAQPPNAFGLYDMHGSIHEWCEDDSHFDYLGAPSDGSPWIESPRTEYRMLKGGYWNEALTYCRAACRSHNPADWREDNLGFRLAAVAQPEVTSFAINGGAEFTMDPAVTLDNTATNSPTEYMASESSDFSGATWQPYDTAPIFDLSFGVGTRTVYFKVRNAGREVSPVVSDTIFLAPNTVGVETGTFTIGRTESYVDQMYGEADEYPRHEVVLGAYQLGKYEVTTKEYCDVLNWALTQGYLYADTAGTPWAGSNIIYAGGTAGSRYYAIGLGATSNIQYTDGIFTAKIRVGLPDTTNYSMDTHPMVRVTWFGAAAFCNWLSQMQGLTPCYDMDLPSWPLTVAPPAPGGYRLPTEAEWERAAAWDVAAPGGPKHWTYGFMSDTLTGKDRVNYGDLNPLYVNPLGMTAEPYTSPVGWFNGVNVSPNGSVATVDSPSPVGAYDMSGNMSEWCQDWYSSMFYSTGWISNPTGPPVGSSRVLRGGSYLNAHYRQRSAERSFSLPHSTFPTMGFRIARSEPSVGVSSFAINNGDATTLLPSVTLDNTCWGAPTEYMASESADFSGATWQPYDTAPTFTLSLGTGGAKTVYFKVRNAEYESAPVSDTIDLTGRIIALPGDVPLELVWVPSGTFQMGRYPGEADSDAGEDPQHPVTLAYGYWMGKYEITQQQWLAVRGSWPRTFPNSGTGLGDSYPAYNITWDDAKDFITTLNAHIVSSGQGPLTVRLPSEAEWEYACRAGTTTRFYWGDDPACTEIDAYAWYTDNNSPNGTKPVGGKTANALGLYDMSGNVYEWCEDDYHSSYTGAPADGGAYIDAPRGLYRIVRGGCWIAPARCGRSAYRDISMPDSWYNVIGFRLAAVPTQVLSFAINGGAVTTADPVVTLDNATTNSPTEYMASELPDFSGATWQPYDTAPSFTLSFAEGGMKTVYFKVRNEAGESAPVSDTINLPWRTITLPGDVPLELVWVPAGSFQMGRYPGEQDSFDWEDPQHPVTLVYGFWMGKYEITQQQWLAVRGSWPGETPSVQPSAMYGLGNSYPAYYLSWNDAKDFIIALDAHIVTSGQGPLTVRLPSEAEWEYACRAGTTTRFYCGDAPACDGVCSDCAAGTLPGNLGDYLWYCGNESPLGSKPVGGKLPNAFGLYDMHGNAREWCEDDTHYDYLGAPADGNPWVESPRTAYRILRGGSFSELITYSRSACRGSYPTDLRDLDTGFRLAALPTRVLSFAINGGAPTTAELLVTLDNTSTNSPTEYMASEAPDFSGATWQPYDSAPSFTLSFGVGARTVYFKVRDAGGEVFNVVSDTIFITPNTVSVDTGTFTMGRLDSGTNDDVTYGAAYEIPRHEVTLGAYQLGKFEITNKEYCDVLNWAKAQGYLYADAAGTPWTGSGNIYAGGTAGSRYLAVYIISSECDIIYSGGVFTSKTRAGLPGTTYYSMDTHPMIAVSWYGAVAFCNWLSEWQGLTPCYDMNSPDWPLTVAPPTPGGYRLPTEAEWERAAGWDAAGGGRHWIYGFLSDTLTGKDRANYVESGVGRVNPLGLTTSPRTSPVGWFNGVNVSPNGSVATVDSPSPVGAYDMSGNISEWCQDWFSATYYSDGPLTNPPGPVTGANRIYRGGNWYNDRSYSRTACRVSDIPTAMSSSMGFRLARSEPSVGVTSFAINNGDETTMLPSVTLNNTCWSTPTEYMASESSDFSGATWQPYATAPSFTLSFGVGDRTVYFKVRDADGHESQVVSDTIFLTPNTVSVETGTFTMGRLDSGTNDDVTYGAAYEIPRHEVTLGAYQLGKFEVTNKEYCDVLNWALAQGYLYADAAGTPWAGSGDIYAGGTAASRYRIVSLVSSGIQYSGGVFTSRTQVGLPGTTNYSMDTHPMENVSWYGAVAFCNWLNEWQGLTPCYDMNSSLWPLTIAPPAPGGYRLPTEAEWERAAGWDSAGGGRHWIYGFLSDTLTGRDRANHNRGYPDYVNPLGLTIDPRTSPVGWFNGVNVSPNGSVATVDSPSPVGAYDMSGNVREWCHDWYADNYGDGPVTNPTGPATGTLRINRGGGWNNQFNWCRSACRVSYAPTTISSSMGFRLARS